MMNDPHAERMVRDALAPTQKTRWPEPIMDDIDAPDAPREVQRKWFGHLFKDGRYDPE